MNKKTSRLAFNLEDEATEEQAAPIRRLTPARLPVDLVDAAKIYAVKNKTTLQNLIEEGLRKRINYI
jgi:hypothetical protein